MEEKKDKPTPKGASATKAPPTLPIVELKDDPILNRLRARFPTAVLEAVEILGLPTLTIAREQIVDVCRFLRDDEEALFDFLTDHTGSTERGPCAGGDRRGRIPPAIPGSPRSSEPERSLPR